MVLNKYKRLKEKMKWTAENKDYKGFLKQLHTQIYYFADCENYYLGMKHMDLSINFIGKILTDLYRLKLSK